LYSTLLDNHAYQMMVESIHDLPEDQWVYTFDTNIHRTSPTTHQL